MLGKQVSGLGRSKTSVASEVLAWFLIQPPDLQRAILATSRLHEVDRPQRLLSRAVVGLTALKMLHQRLEWETAAKRRSRVGAKSPEERFCDSVLRCLPQEDRDATVLEFLRKSLGDAASTDSGDAGCPSPVQGADALVDEYFRRLWLACNPADEVSEELFSFIAKLAAVRREPYAVAGGLSMAVDLVLQLVAPVNISPAPSPWGAAMVAAIASVERIARVNEDLQRAVLETRDRLASGIAEELDGLEPKARDHVLSLLALVARWIQPEFRAGAGHARIKKVK